MRLQWGRGFAATEGKSRWRGTRSGIRFNGAVASQPRKGRSVTATVRAAATLQSGRGFAATEGLKGAEVYAWPVLLQLGRGFTATEGDLLGQERQVVTDASTGPWLRSHGKPIGAYRALCEQPLQ